MQFNIEHQIPGDNQYIAHESMTLSDDHGALIGEVLYSLYDAQSAEADRAPIRFIAHPDSYLSKVESVLFEPNQQFAVLPQAIREDLSAGFQHIIIIDEINIDKALLTNAQVAAMYIKQVVVELSKRSAMVLINEWQSFGRHLMLSPKDMLSELQSVGMVPFNEHFLIAFSEDLPIHTSVD